MGTPYSATSSGDGRRSLPTTDSSGFQAWTFVIRFTNFCRRTQIVGQVSLMSPIAQPILLFILFATLVGIAMIAMPWLLAPRRPGTVKEMPYESGMDPIHDARRRFDVRF